MADEVESWPFYSRKGLNSETYDARTPALLRAQGLDADVGFYAERARASAQRAGRTSARVLELGCGTGRVAWSLVEGGHEVVGLDAALPMLQQASAKASSCTADECARARFVPGDMTDFELGAAFDLIIAPFRAFQALLDPEAQRACLRCCRAHLAADGELVLHLFDPRLDMLVDSALALSHGESVVHPATGETVTIDVLSDEKDMLAQSFTQAWRFRAFDEAGETTRVEHETLAMRWTYRWEMRHLLELSGFTVVAEHSDFEGSPPAYGAEQVWIARLDTASP